MRLRQRLTFFVLAALPYRERSGEKRVAYHAGGVPEISRW